MDILSMMPGWWDTLTLIRLGILFGLALPAWLLAGFYFAPYLFERFDQATSGYVAWMVEMFDKMFLTVPARWCVAMIIISMGLFTGLGLFLTSGLPAGTGYNILRLVICLFLAFGPFKIPLGANLPRFVVNKMWTRRVKKFEDQLLDGLAFLSNGLKSGLSVVQAMQMVKDELPNPISQEFGVVLNEQRLGVPMEDALLNLEKRVDTEDVQILVTSINILRQSGGNLAETFDTIAYTIRERKKVEGKIRSLTAQGVSQGVIIVCMPFGLAAVLYMFDAELIARLWTTALGWAMLAFMVFLQTCGALMIRKIVTIRV
jgi:tight adherence protein B